MSLFFFVLGSPVYEQSIWMFLCKPLWVSRSCKGKQCFLDLSDVWPVVGDRTYSLALQIKHHCLNRIWPNLPPPAHPHIEITPRGNQFRLCIQLLKQFMRFDEDICCRRVIEVLNEVLEFLMYKVCNYFAFEILPRTKAASTTQAGELGESPVC